MRDDAMADPGATRLARAATLLAAVLLLAACGSTPKPARAPGGYYQDDGPPRTAPADLARVPDAVPRDEPFHRFANRPYTVFGRTYVPVVNREPLRERGIASWYGRKFHGQKTASGEVYDMFAMTAAHRTLPIPSYARVTNLDNGRSVVVRINDRGPFHDDRVIDLSYAAAARLGFVEHGTAPVEVERVLPGAGDPAAAAALPAPAPTIQTPMAEREPGALWLQVGAFSSREAAEVFRDRVARDMPWLLEPIQVERREGLYRVRLGPYRNNDEAAAIGEKVRRSVGIAPVLVIR